MTRSFVTAFYAHTMNPQDTDYRAPWVPARRPGAPVVCNLLRQVVAVCAATLGVLVVCRQLGLSVLLVDNRDLAESMHYYRPVAFVLSGSPALDGCYRKMACM